MNGDIGKVYKVVNEIKVEVATVKTTQKLQHIENKKDIGRLYKWLWAITIMFVGASLTLTVQAIAK